LNKGINSSSFISFFQGVLYFDAVKLSENTVREIADWLQCGLECWIHKKRGNMYFLPNLEDPYFDPTQWEDILVHIQGHENEYLVFQTMDSSHSYRIMENFTSSLDESDTRLDLELALARPRPFHHFNALVRDSLMNEKWADFKFSAHMDWVKSQIDCYELVS